MKQMLLLMIALFLLLFSTVFAEEAVPGEQAEPLDTALEETVWRVMEFPWSGEARCIYNYIDHDTYTEAILGYDHINTATKEVERIDPVATVLVDRVTGKVIYYRRMEYQMPPFLNTSGLFGLHDNRDMIDRWSKLKQKWQDWGKQTYEELTGESRTSCDFLRCRDESCVLFAFCNSPHGDLHAAMIVRLPDEQNPEPLLMAYADLETNPSVGYDGYLTADQATDAALGAIREKSGEETLRDLRLCYRAFTIYDFVVNLIVVNLMDEDEYDSIEDPNQLEDQFNPMWCIGFEYENDALPENDENERAWIWEYWVWVDDVTGETLKVCEPYTVEWGS